MNPKIFTRRLRAGFLTPFLASALCLLAACSSPAYLDNSQPVARGGKKLMAVVDAGSGGSRIHLYKTVADESFVQIQELFVKKGSAHALSWYDGSQGEGSAPAHAGSAGIEPLLLALKAYLNGAGIPQEQISVNVLATAGMRMVNPQTASAIYQSVKSTISGNGFSYAQVGTISGQAEGLYAWADVNYLFGNFKTGAATQGIVEIGGASSQVAFVTSSSNDANVVIKNINGVTYPVFSVSYLGLGQSQARLAMIGHSDSGGLGSNVCYPNAVGSPTSYDADIGNIAISASGSNYSAACYGVFQKIISSVTANAVNNYPVSRVPLLGNFNATQFVGISAVHNVSRDWVALDSGNPLLGLDQTLTSTCSGSNAWPRVLAQYKNVNSVFAQNGCANATYLSAYVYGRQSLNIDPHKLTGLSRIRGNELTWTRGFVVLANSR